MMLTTLINWRSVGDTPESDEPISVVMASEHEGFVYLEPHLYNWVAGEFIDEVDGRVNTTATWWAPESELTAPLNAALAFTRQRAEARHVG